MSATKERKKREKGKLKKVLYLYKRALGLMWKEAGDYMVIRVVQWVLYLCSPYWSIWFSARILDEIFGARSLERLVLYTALLLGGNLLLNFLGICMTTLNAQKGFEFGQKQNLIFARKLMELDYSVLEEERIHTLWRRVVRESFNDGKNLETINRNLPVLLGSLVGVGLSIAMVWEFLARMWDYRMLTACFVLLVAAGIWGSAKCGAAVNRVWLECNRSISENCTQRDGYLDYFNQYERGKEIRIYQLGKLMNGSGKSTFIKLLCRLYDPTEGTITMNGIDIRRYDYQEYMSLFSVVFQDFQLFSFTLGENVAVSEDYQEEAVRDALGKAGMEEFLENHGNSLSTVLYRDFDKDGVEVSGGEAQKIALARAVCKGAPFVLLDEPTAALDPRAEYEIYKRFNDLVADRTTVYISHRMSSCRFCGDIAVFHEGRVVQRGSHESLMQETNGKYYELWTAQAQYYSEEASETIAG